MGHDVVRPVVPRDAQDQLRELFAGELAKRLPRLMQARTGGVEDREAAIRDAHNLGSSAYIVGDPEIAALARAVERDLDGGPLDELVSRLQAWHP